MDYAWPLGRTILSIKYKFNTEGIIMDYANWMRDNFDYIKDRSIWNIAIPGTHGSGTFSANNTIGVRNQNQNIGDQLKGGIRAFDIRVRYVESKDKYFMAHNNYWCSSQDFFEAMRQVWLFTVDHPGEIVIIQLESEGEDKKNGLNSDRRSYILRMVKEILRHGDSGLLPYGDKPTDDYLVKDLVKTNRRIIVLNSFPERSQFLNYFWGINEDTFYSTWKGSIDDGRKTIGKKVGLLEEHLPIEFGNRTSHKRFFWAALNLWTINIHNSAKYYEHPLAHRFFESNTANRNKAIYGIDFYTLSDYVEKVINLNKITE